MLVELAEQQLETAGWTICWPLRTLADVPWDINAEPFEPTLQGTQKPLVGAFKAIMRFHEVLQLSCPSAHLLVVPLLGTFSRK